MKTCVGITIGPIYDTIMEASTPAALWYASSLFSDITKRLCQAIITEKSFSGVEILSPYYAEEIHKNDGVGKYHDRLFFSAEVFDEAALKRIIEEIKKNTAQNFPEKMIKDAEDFLRKYLQIHYIIMNEADIEGSVILKLSPYLDALELMKTFPEENTVNPIRALFLGEEENANKYIKNSQMFKDIENSQFVTKGKDGKKKIRSIEEIASDHEKCSKLLKKANYYAMVQADGDGVGSYLEKLSGDSGRVRDFSKSCLKYDEEAAKLIGEFGGMTIYAGGDDLLFLAPVENAQGETVFSLCHKIAETFKKMIGGGPTLSFGISIQYKKFPLYEAHKNSGDLLYTVKNNVEGKNSMAVNVQKHSGQSLGLVLSNDDFDTLEKALNIGADIQNPEEKVTSVIQTLETFRGLLVILNTDPRTRENKTAYQDAFMNLFDNPGQGAAKKYLENICGYFFGNFVSKKTAIGLMPKDAQNQKKEEEMAADASVGTLLYILRLKKFLCEKGEEA